MDALRKAEEAKRLQNEAGLPAVLGTDTHDSGVIDAFAEAQPAASPAAQAQSDATASESAFQHVAEPIGAATNGNDNGVAQIDSEHPKTIPSVSSTPPHPSLSSFLLALEPLAVAPHDAQSAAHVPKNTATADAYSNDEEVTQSIVEQSIVASEIDSRVAAAPHELTTPNAETSIPVHESKDISAANLLAEFDVEFGRNSIATPVQDPLAQLETFSPTKNSTAHSAPQVVALAAVAKPNKAVESAHPSRSGKTEASAASLRSGKADTKTETSGKSANPAAAAERTVTATTEKPSASPVSAAKVLTAGTRPKNNRKLLAASVATVLLMFGAGGFYVYQEQQRLATPMLAANFPPASIADGENESNTLVSAPPIAATVTPGTQPGASSTEKTTQSTKQATAPSVSAAKSMTPERAHSKHNEVVRAVAVGVSEQPVDPDTTSGPATPKASAKSAKKADRDVPQPSVVTTVQQANPVVAAYAAFQKGDMALAHDLYQSALNQDGNNRDALLGAAAIALRTGDNQYAKSLYERVLRQWASDQVAAAGLLNVLGESEPLRAESELKYLLSDQSDSAALHFVLGNVYIRQERWSDAEAEFFSAYRLDRNNADFAYNLAVCLDHLGQRGAALEHYRTAHSLAKNSNGNFDRAAVERRIALLGDAQKIGTTP